MKKIDRAWHDLHFWLKREVSTKKGELLNIMKYNGGDDKTTFEGNVFGRLIKASIENSKEFDESEVVGNLFIFFFAGVSLSALFISSIVLTL